jgi:hypothetical protein
MASQWGNNSLSPGSSQGWFFARSAQGGFLPYISVIPTSPSFTDGQTFFNGPFPDCNELGIGTQWSQLSDDGSTLTYFLVVMNNSNNTVEYSFVEADF